MRRDFHFTKWNIDYEKPEIWEAIKGAIADSEGHNFKGGPEECESILEHAVRYGLLEIKGNMDDDLDSEDDKVNFKLIKTPLGIKNDQELKGMGLI